MEFERQIMQEEQSRLKKKDIEYRYLIVNNELQFMWQGWITKLNMTADKHLLRQE